jgi:hypothetical protein
MTETRPAGGRGERIETTYKYRVRGPVARPVAEELRRVHDQDNTLIELELAYQKAKTAAWEEDPQVAQAVRAVEAAVEDDETARDALATARQRAHRARKAGNTAGPAGGQAEADAARDAAKDARNRLRTARDHLRAVKAERWPQAQRSIAAARDARDAAINGTYAQAREAGMFWASWADTVRHHKAAVQRVNDRRKEGRPAQLRRKRWNGTGTITVQLQRELGVTVEERAEVARLRAQGLNSRQIAERTRFPARTVARIKDEGPATAGDPPCSPAMLASGAGKWRNLFRLGPELPGDFSERRRGDRRRIARQGSAVIRVGAGRDQTLVELPVTIHRPMPPGAEARIARLTVTRCGPDIEQNLTIVATIPAPGPPQTGRTVAVHTGWRALPDGCLRVAVVAGAGPVPDGVRATGTVRALTPDGPGPAGCREVIIPAAWRDEQARIDKARAARDTAFNRAAGLAAAWLDANAGIGDGLPAAAEIRQHRSPGQLAALARRAAAGEHGEGARALGAMLASWAEDNRRAWRNEARSRRRLTRRRDAAWAKVAEWLCRDATEVVTDEWEISTLARRPDRGDDDPQAAAARANRTFAAPGALRERISNAARRRGITVVSPGGRNNGERAWVPQAHWRCGGELHPDDRRKGILVPCRRCGQVVDQDVNMTAVMLDP